MSPSCRVKVFKRYADSGGPYGRPPGGRGFETDSALPKARAGDFRNPKGYAKEAVAWSPSTDDPSRYGERSGPPPVPSADANRPDTRRPAARVLGRVLPAEDEGATEQLFATARALRELAPDFVSVTYGAGGSTREGTVEITQRAEARARPRGDGPPELRRRDRDGLAATLDRIADAGIENVFALRGDPPRGQNEFVQPEGGLGSAAELAEFISERYDFTIGGACFPEVHPEAADLDADLAYLRTKVDAGARFLITQLFFDNQVYFDFVEAARRAGIEVPIIAGVIPVASFAQTKRICALCDATIPPRLAEAMLAAGGDPEAEFELGVAYASQQCAELLHRRRAGDPLLRAEPRTRDARGARRPARGAALGASEDAAPPGVRRSAASSGLQRALTTLPAPWASSRYEGYRITLRRVRGRRPAAGPDPRPADEPPHVRALAPAMAERGNRVICVDLLGHGRSDRPEDLRLYSMPLFARQVVALLDHLELEEAVVGGTSLGANVGARVGDPPPRAVRGDVHRDAGPRQRAGGGRRRSSRR